MDIVLFQQSLSDGKWYLVVFYSKLLSLVEWNYKIYNKEMLAIIWVLEELRYFLKEAAYPVEIWIDYKNLKYFIMTKKLNCCQARWSLYLIYFNFTLCHCPKWSMGKPNALSQRLDHKTRTGNNGSIILLYPELFTICIPEEVELIGVEQKVLSEIYYGNYKGDLKGPVTKAAQELCQSTNRSIHLLE